MPLDVTQRSLIGLVRAIVKASVTEAQAAVRTPRILTGVVDSTTETGDVVWVRMDQEAMSGDPTLSNNWGLPGVLPITPLGQVAEGEQVRVEFDPRAGASAMRTGLAAVGQRLETDATLGIIRFYAGDTLVGYLDATRWELGVPGFSLARLDPFGGLRLRDESDVLRVQVSAAEGVIVREANTGISGAILASDGLIILDPDTGDQISIQSGTQAAIPTPHWAGSGDDTTPGATHPTPATTLFTADDIALRWVCASADADLGAQSYSPPAGYTERSEVNSSGGGLTLATSLATLDPATTPGVADFTNTSAAWDRINGHTLVIRGGGPTSPAFRSVSSSTVIDTTDATISLAVALPSGTVQGDMVAVFVAMVSTQVPVGWTVPEGWKQVGIAPVGGLGTSQVLASGCWTKRIGASEPNPQPVTINMSAAGHTKLHVTAVAISNPYAYPAGLDIRRNNRSMPRGLVAEATPITTSTTDWAYTSLPQTITSINDVPLLAGRKYRPRFYCTSILTTLTDGNSGRWGLFIQRDPGSGFVDVLGLGQRERYGAKPSAFTFDREPMSGDLDYVPTADETADWRVRLVHIGGINYSVQLEASATGPIRFWFEDIGAIF